MGKQIIRLTESDLHQMVKESVNKILSELDWRTYASANEKATNQFLDKVRDGVPFEDLKNDKRARQANSFRKASVDALNKKFGGDNTEDFELYPTIGGKGLKKGEPYKPVYHANAENGDWPSGMESTVDGKATMRGLSRPKRVNVTPERYFGGDKDKIAKWNEFSGELNDYNNGKSKYVKGKGWE